LQPDKQPLCSGCGLSASRAELALTAIKRSMHQTPAERFSECVAVTG
jgi:hypothetical protein